MINVLATEWLKMKKYKPFWIVFCLYPVCLAGVVALSVWTQGEVQIAADKAVPGASALVESYLPFAFPRAWQAVAYLASWLHFIPASLLIMMVSNEFGFRTHRQNLLDGWSRAQFLMAKGSLVLALSAYSTVLVVVLSIAAGVKSGSSPTMEGSFDVLLFFLQCLVYQTFALIVAFLIRRAAPALAGFFIYTMFLENIFAFLINLKFTGLGNFLPLEAAGGLLPIPFVEENAPEVAKQLLGRADETALIVASCLYLVGFFAFLWLRFRREDL